MELLPGVSPVALLLARTDDTVVALTDVRGYLDGFAFLLRVRGAHLDIKGAVGRAYARWRALPWITFGFLTSRPNDPIRLPGVRALR
jgi:hypothetical protein